MAADPLVLSGVVDVSLDEVVADPERYPLARFHVSPIEHCPLCVALDGQVFEVDSPEFRKFTPPLHINCACWWEYVGRTDAERKGLHASFSPPEEILVQQHGHFVQDPEKYAVLKVPAGPAGRPFRLIRERDLEGNMVSRLQWNREWARFEVEGFENLLPAKDETDLANPDLRHVAIGLLALDRLPAKLRPKRVVFSSERTGSTAALQGDTLLVSVPALKNNLRSQEWRTIPGDVRADVNSDVRTFSNLYLAQSWESFVMVREVFLDVPQGQVGRRMDRIRYSLTFRGARRDAARIDRADWLAWTYLRNHGAAPYMRGIYEPEMFAAKALLAEERVEQLLGRDAPRRPAMIPESVRREYPELEGALREVLRVDEAGSEVVQLHLRELARVPAHLLRKLRLVGLREIHLGDRTVPDLDANEELRGNAPRGHPAGSTWDDLPGAYNRTKLSVVAGRGGHGSPSVAGHEVGHALFHLLWERHEPDLARWHAQVYPRLHQYFQQGGPGGDAGVGESVAESVASFIMGEEEGISRSFGDEWLRWLKRRMQP